MVHGRCDVLVDAFLSLFIHDVPVCLSGFLLELLHSSVKVVMIKLLVQYLPVGC
jgi:hypothetical protein